MKISLYVLFASSIVISSMLNCDPGYCDKIDDLVASQMQSQHIPGLSLAVVLDGKVVKDQGYGYANIDKKAVAAPSSVYEIGSVTKQFTATLIMMLVEQHKISLDDKLSAYVNLLPANWDNVTLRELLNHTSGINDYTSVDNIDTLMVSPTKPGNVLSTIDSSALDFPSGTEFKYSNTGYFLLGMVIEKVTGKSFADVLQERIFNPLKMTESSVLNPGASDINRATGYIWQNAAFQKARQMDTTWSYSAGSVATSVDDLMKWNSAIDQSSLISADSQNTMWSAGLLSSGEQTHYGFGWNVSEVNGHQKLSHPGGISGFASYIAKYPSDHLTVILLTNSFSGDLTSNTPQIGDEIADIELPVLAQKPVNALADTTPAVTKQLTSLLEQVASGSNPFETNPDLFSSGLASLGYTQFQDGLGKSLASLGLPEKIVLFDKPENKTNQEYRYLAFYTSATMENDIVVSKDGKIVAWMLTKSDAKLSDKTLKPNDPNPKIGVMIKAVLLKAQVGKVDSSSFTPGYWKSIYPNDINATTKTLKLIGAFQSMTFTGTLIDRKSRMIYEYDTKFANGTIHVSCVMNKLGKIEYLELD